MAYLFWIGLSVVVYTYIGYGILVYVLSLFRTRRLPAKHQSNASLPRVTLLIAAYNEEDFIVEKIQDCLRLDYPADKLDIVVVTDGSTDRTPEIVQSFSQVRHYHEPARKGKIHAVNRVMKNINTPITVFCDANTFLNKGCLRNLVRHYADPTVGGVAGEKRIFKKQQDSASGAGEGLYWKYESFLKRKDAEVYSIVGAAGELFSVRTALYEEPPAEMIIEDFYLSLRIAAKGHRFAYEPDAYATETASVSVAEEWKRKVRICAGGFQAMGRLSYLLNPFKYGILTLQYFSHRVLRWTLAPVFLPVIFLSSLVLAITGGWFYLTTLLLQLAFYGLAAAGYVMRDRPVSIKGFFVPYYFVVMNAAVYAGFLRHVRGRQTVVWERARRAQLDPK